MSRLQFTIRGLLLATFWLAVSMGAWMAAAPTKERPIHYFAAGSIIAIFAAAGALFEHTLQGLLVGIIVVGLGLWALVILVRMGYVSFPI